jgi:hypothetical protein
MVDAGETESPLKGDHVCCPRILVQDSSGTLFGMTAAGGRACRIASRPNDTCGVLDQLTPNGNA